MNIYNQLTAVVGYICNKILGNTNHDENKDMKVIKQECPIDILKKNLGDKIVFLNTVKGCTKVKGNRTLWTLIHDHDSGSKEYRTPHRNRLGLECNIYDNSAILFSSMGVKVRWRCEFMIDKSRLLVGALNGSNEYFYVTTDESYNIIALCFLDKYYQYRGASNRFSSNVYEWTDVYYRDNKWYLYHCKYCREDTNPEIIVIFDQNPLFKLLSRYLISDIIDNILTYYDIDL